MSASRRRGVLIGAMALVVLLAVAGILAVAVTSSSGSSTKQVDPRVTQMTLPGAISGGTAAPNFRLTTLDGKTISLRQFAGHPVVVNFWASWCYPCRQEFPLLRSAYARHHKDGLVMIGVVSQDIPSDARQFVEQEHASWPMAVDGDRAAQTAYGVRGLPQTMFIRRDGTIARRELSQLTSATLQTGLSLILH
ncbi:MAG TPA: redoxin domain-containing protein [Acidimicrobiia bacterium]|nr:redoxin domain-containing protein [Acidimicrobiia bacterium]